MAMIPPEDFLSAGIEIQNALRKVEHKHFLLDSYSGSHLNLSILYTDLNQIILQARERGGTINRDKLKDVNNGIEHEHFLLGSHYNNIEEDIRIVNGVKEMRIFILDHERDFAADLIGLSKTHYKIYENCKTHASLEKRYSHLGNSLTQTRDPSITYKFAYRDITTIKNELNVLSDNYDKKPDLHLLQDIKNTLLSEEKAHQVIPANLLPRK